MKYTITPHNQLIAVKPIILTFIYFVLFFEYREYTHGTDKFFLEFYSIFFGLVFIPVVYLHIEYYYFNRGTTLDIELGEKKLIYTNKSGIVETIWFTDISKIIYYMDNIQYQKRKFSMLPFTPYLYATIITKNEEKIIITSLMAPNLESVLSNISGVPIEKKIRIVASILIH